MLIPRKNVKMKTNLLSSWFQWSIYFHWSDT